MRREIRDAHWVEEALNGFERCDELVVEGGSGFEAGNALFCCFPISLLFAGDRTDSGSEISSGHGRAVWFVDVFRAVEAVGVGCGGGVVDVVLVTFFV